MFDILGYEAGSHGHVIVRSRIMAAPHAIRWEANENKSGHP